MQCNVIINHFSRSLILLYNSLIADMAEKTNEDFEGKKNYNGLPGYVSEVVISI